MRYLVVDDSARVRARLVTLLLEVDDGASVEEAAAAEDAVICACDRPPDVVVLDLQVPVCGGLAILARLKALPSRPVVVVLTNHPTDHHRRESLARGADHFFDKSKDFSDIVTVVRAARRTKP